jgi:diguanylate cyclase (GGDEF)-like protein
MVNAADNLGKPLLFSLSIGMDGTGTGSADLPTTQRAAEAEEVKRAAIITFRDEIATALRLPDFAAALTIAVDARLRFASAGNRRGEANALFVQGMIYRHLENCPHAHNLLQESQQIWEEIGDKEGVSRCLIEHGGTCVHQADFTGAMAYFQQCLLLCELIGDSRRAMACRSNIAALHLEVGDCAAALEMMHPCLSYFEQQNDIAQIIVTLHNIADVYFLRGAFEETIRFARRGYDIWSASGGTYTVPEIPCHLLSTLGTAYHRLGEWDEARTCLQDALTWAQKIGLPWMMAKIWSDLGAVFAEQGQYTAAQNALQQSLCLNGPMGTRFVYAEALARLGILYATPAFLEHSDVRALELLETARQIAQECDSPALLIPVYTALTELHERQGRLPEAIASLRLLQSTERRLFNAESDRRIRRTELDKAQRDAEILYRQNAELTAALAEAERLHRLADKRARTDALTGVLNRWALEEHFAEEWQRAQRQKHPLSLAILDIDHFKRINDTYGHAVGDRALSRVAALLYSCCRPQDVAARYGGEEFAVLFPATMLAQAVAVCECLRQRIAAEDWTRLHPELQTVTLSGGVSVFDAADFDTRRENEAQRDLPFEPSALFLEADQYLYYAKRSGRNRIVSALSPEVAEPLLSHLVS